MAQYLAHCLLLVVSVIVPTASAGNRYTPDSITVITADDHPVLGLISSVDFTPPIKRLNLDAVGRLETRLGNLLPANEVQAEALVKQRIALIGEGQLNIDLRDAYQAISLSMTYALDRYPAIIFDDKAVVYGVTDLSLAIDKYELWIEASRKGVSGE